MVSYVKHVDTVDIEIDMDAEIKLKAYTYNKYDTVNRTIKYISPSSFNSEQLGSVYHVKLEITDVPEGINIVSGLSGSAEIKTDKRIVMEYFLDPIMKGFLGENEKESALIKVSNGSHKKEGYMSRKYIFSEAEYNSLRSELVSRIGLINSQSSTALTTIISTWAAGLTLLIFLFGQNNQLSDYTEIVIGFINSLIFLIPVAYFIPLAIKSGENLTQIASLSAYIRVFFEYLSERSENDTLPRYGWEATNTLVSNINALRKSKGRILLMFNEEFTILSIASVMIYFISAELNIARIYQSESVSALILIIASIVYAVFAVLAIVTVNIIHRSSCTKLNLMEKSSIYIEAYIYKAAELGLINQNQINKVKQKLDPNKRLYRHDGSEIS